MAIHIQQLVKPEIITAAINVAEAARSDEQNNAIISEASLTNLINVVAALETEIHLSYTGNWPTDSEHKKQIERAVILASLQDVTLPEKLQPHISGFLDYAYDFWYQRTRSFTQALLASDATVRGTSAIPQRQKAEELAQRLGFKIIDLPPVTISPQTGMAPQTGSGAGWKQPELKDRLGEVIEWLQRHNHIHYGEEITIFRGNLRDAQMRSTPYYIADLPRSGKQVAVCNEVGEAMFVTHRLLVPAEWSLYPKPLLENYIGATRVEMHSGWEGDLAKAMQQPRAENQPILTAEEIARRQKDLQDRKTIRLTPELIGYCMFTYFLRTGTLPKSKANTKITEFPQYSWRSWNRAVYGKKDFSKTTAACLTDILRLIGQVILNSKGQLPQASTGVIECAFVTDTNLPQRSWQELDDELGRHARIGYTNLVTLWVYTGLRPAHTEQELFDICLRHSSIEPLHFVTVASGKADDLPMGRFDLLDTKLRKGHMPGIEAKSVFDIVNRGIRNAIFDWYRNHTDQTLSNSERVFLDQRWTIGLIRKALVNRASASGTLENLLYSEGKVGKSQLSKNFIIQCIVAFSTTYRRWPNQGDKDFITDGVITTWPALQNNLQRKNKQLFDCPNSLPLLIEAIISENLEKYIETHKNIPPINSQEILTNIPMTWQDVYECCFTNNDHQFSYSNYRKFFQKYDANFVPPFQREDIRKDKREIGFKSATRRRAKKAITETTRIASIQTPTDTPEL